VPRELIHGPALWEALQAIPAADRDAWVDTLLGIDSPPPDVDLPRGAVPYLPCGVEEIVTMVRELPLRVSDELVDLGSGLGRVVMLAHLLSGARAHGIEIQAHLVERGRVRSRELGLAGVSFTHANAAEVDLDGSVFFLYAPFNGAMLTRVVQRLEAVARRRSIVIGSVGVELDESWLVARETSSRALTIYEPVVQPSRGL
jgi:hypothetical protein